jgi:spectrin beta
LKEKSMSVNNTTSNLPIPASWRSGLGFNALIHSHRPDLIDFNKLTPGKHIDNLNYAFDVAQNELGVPRLLDAEGKLQC